MPDSIGGTRALRERTAGLLLDSALFQSTALCRRTSRASTRRRARRAWAGHPHSGHLMRWLLLLVFIFLTARCSAPNPGGMPTASRPVLTETTTPLPTRKATAVWMETLEPKIEIYRKGDPVTFQLDDTIYFCAGQSTFSIAQITENEKRELSLRHSCLGFVGTGTDQYCQDGQVKTVFVGECSDAIPCGKQSIHGTITWDQKEYVAITEKCAGQTIHREVEQQVPEGNYQITAQVIQNGTIMTRVIKEFVIVSDASGGK